MKAPDERTGRPVDGTTLDAIARALHEADRAVALTGAGLSAASGIPTFRGTDGIWGEIFDERDFHVSRFERDPAEFWRDRLELYDHMEPEGGAEPNVAHEALAELTNSGLLEAVVTQNTDGLHGAANTAGVVELHGSNARVTCHRCGHRTAAGPVRERVRNGELPPVCDEPDCSGTYKPDVVLFGERLPPEALRRATELAAGCDVFLVAGSSLTVEPAALLPQQTNDGTLVLINLERTRYSGMADYDLRANVTEVLPEIVDRIQPIA